MVHEDSTPRPEGSDAEEEVEWLDRLAAQDEGPSPHESIRDGEPGLPEVLGAEGEFWQGDRESEDRAAPTVEIYAEVCVNTPLGRQIGPSLGADREADPEGRTFTYHIPDRFAGRLQVGHLVWVPFRSRRLQAVVLRVTDQAPAFDTLDVEALVWAQPVLTPVQLDLARWLSGYYLAPLIEVLRMMLPARIAQRGRTVFTRTAALAPADLTPSQAALLQQIASAEGTWPEVSEGLKVTQKADLEPLIQAGLVAREVAFAAPPPRPKVNRRVRLLADDAAIDRILPTLGRTSIEADILAWLAGQEDALAPVEELCKATGCTPDRVRDLAKNGRFTFIAPRTFVRRTIPDADLPRVLEKLGAEKPSAAKKRAAALAALPSQSVDEAEYRANNKVEAATLRGLTEQGLAERAEEAARVRLAVPRETVLEILIDMRGVKKHRQVIDALRRHEGPPWIGWLYAETDANINTLHDLESAGLITVDEEVIWRDPLAGQEFHADHPPVLTPDQERAWEAVREAIDRSVARDASGPAGLANLPTDQSPISHPQSPGLTFLLFGVTGSGKTEIYLHGIAEVLRHGRQAVVLVPEIALTPQTVQRFAARFPGRVTVWHSNLSDGERFDMWRRVRTGHPAAQVVVGSRSALFLPYPHLGLIVVDEEHESSYKQVATPRYHARTAALELGRLANIPALLGSATPSLESYYTARNGAMRLVALPRRILSKGAVGQAPVVQLPLAPLRQPESAPSDLPHVSIIDMRQELRAGNRTMFSRELASALQEVLEKEQQAILYLNRRGTSSFVLCRDCGHVEACPRCAVPLTYHGVGSMLVCHHCNRRYPVPATCPQCHSPRIRYFGSGTQNLEEAVRQSFPKARTLRWDRDVTGSKGAHETILRAFAGHQADVLVGTQMIAKGLDLPLVTLVGVIAADTGLFLPDFRAGERTFQLLTQVAGRAGRSALGGQVIIQTYRPDHYAIMAASHHDFEGFYRQEMTFRREQGYPPIRRLARLVVYQSQQAKAQAAASRAADLLKAEMAALALPDTDLIGPAPCFFGQQRGEYRWQVVVRSPDPAALLRRIPLEPGWRVDVDPTDLL